MDNINKLEVVESLKKELDTCNESIARTKDEINTKRRMLTELLAKKQNLEDKIKAKRLENLESLVLDKLGLNISELTEAVENGGVLVENAKEGTVQTDKDSTLTGTK